MESKIVHKMQPRCILTNKSASPILSTARTSDCSRVIRSWHAPQMKSIRMTMGETGIKMGS